MKRIIPIHRNESSVAVAHLHLALQTLGYTAISLLELQTRTAGHATESAVRSFQAQHKIAYDPTTLVDEATATQFNAVLEGQGLLEEDRFIIHGTVSFRGLPVPDVKVQGFDQDLPSKPNSLEPLADAITTDARGRYIITYDQKQFSDTEKQSADVVVAVAASDGVEIYRTGVLYNAAREVIIDIELEEDPVTDRTSEFSRYIEEITPLLGEVAIASLTQEDLVFLNRETAIDASHLSYLNTAHVWSADNGDQVVPELFYALFRSGYTTSIQRWVTKKMDDYLESVQEAIDQNIIAAAAVENIEEQLNLLMDYVLQEAQNASTADHRASLGEILSTVIGDAALRNSFLAEYRDGSGDIAQFWENLQADPELGGSVPALQLAFQLSELTLNNLPLIEAIQSDPEITGIQDLVSWDIPEWSSRITDYAVPVPAHISGADDAEKRTNYSKNLKAIVEKAFPTQTVAHRVTRQPEVNSGIVAGAWPLLGENPSLIALDVEDLSFEGWSDEDTLEAKQSLGRLQREVLAFPDFEPILHTQIADGSDIQNPIRTQVNNFLEAATDFNFTETPADRYFSEAGSEIWDGIEYQEEVQAQLRRMQRMYNVGGDTEMMFTLLELGMHSAGQISSMPLAHYEQLTSEMGVTKSLATHAKASQISDSIIMIYQSVCEYGKNTMPEAMGPDNDQIETIIKDIPDYEALFGAFDNCECGHCRSVYSAAAYFVDLLHQVLGGKYLDNHPALAKPFEELRERRPDLQFIKLSCENTNTLIPYIDLVNEILETYVGFGALSEAYTRDTSAFTAEELAANPQFIVSEAYTKLKNEYYPIALPFDLSLQTGRTYLEHLGSGLYEVMQTFHTDTGVPAQNALIAERLKLSDKEYEILTTKALDGSNSLLSLTAESLFGYTGVPNFIQELEKAPELFSKLEIDYETLIAMLKTTFINPNFQVAAFLQDPDVLQTDKDTFILENPTLAASAQQDTLVLTAPDDAQCDLSQTTIRHADQSILTEDEFLKIHRFVRLQKKLNTSVKDTDLLITKLSQNGSGEINSVLLDNIGRVIALSDQLNIPYESLLTLWSNINTLGARSLYETLFLNKAALKTDPGFVLNPQRDALETAGQLIAQHIPALLAALRVSEEALQDILVYLQLDPASDPLSIANITAMYRYSVLTKALRMPVKELIAILDLLDFDIFAGPGTTADFLVILEKIKYSRFKNEELQYIYQHETTAGKSTPSVITTLATTIIPGLKKIDRDIQNIQSADAGEIRNKLGKIFDEDIVQQVIGTIAATYSYSTPLNTLPFAGFPPDLEDTFSYDEDMQQLTGKGLMTLSEQSALKALSADVDYTTAVDALFAQPRIFFSDTFYGFLDSNAIGSLFNEQLTPEGETITSAEGRYAYFLEQLLPFLRTRLYHEWIKQAVADHFQLDAGTTALLLETLLVSKKDAGQKLIKDFTDLNANGWDATYFEDTTLTSPVVQRIDAAPDFDWQFDAPDPLVPADNFSVRWEGKLAVPDTETYTFYIRCNDGVRLWIDDQLLIDQWINQPLTTHETAIALKAGVLYNIKLEYYETTATASISLQWSSATMPRQVLPAAYIVPVSVLDIFAIAFTCLEKVAVLVSTFELNAGELSYFSDHPQDFEDFDLNLIPVEAGTYDPKPFKQWLRIVDYTALRERWPVSEENDLIAVFEASSDDFTTLKNALLAASGWKENAVTALLGNDFGQGIWTATADDFKNEQFLITLQSCIDLSRNIGIAEEKLAAWSALNMSEAIAEDIKNTVRAKYDETVWPDISKGIHDLLRSGQRNALVSYLLAQPDMAQKNILTSNDLYQYFLIDVDMEACMMTSRIVQANASIQLFVQRCLMNLEENVSPDMIDANHWKWMKKYRVWEANRKVFLYPENWIAPELRDDKSPFFKTLENELLQGEITNENVEKATINYLKSLDTVARLDIRSLYHADGEVHVFGRTFNTPHNYYYRKYTTTKVWTPWERVQADIEGDLLTAVIWNRRLYLFWPVFTEKAEHNSQDLLSATEPEKYFEVKLAWSEYYQGKWMPKQLSTEFLKFEVKIPELLYTRILNDNTLEVYLVEYGTNSTTTEGNYISKYSWEELGKFSFFGCNKSARAEKIEGEEIYASFEDSYEEVYKYEYEISEDYDIFYTSEEGNHGILLNHELINPILRMEENFPRFLPGKSFFLQDEYKSYWVTSKPRRRKAIAEKPTFTAAPELPIWVDDNPLTPWWEQLTQNPEEDGVLDWDAPMGFDSFSAGTEIIPFSFDMNGGSGETVTYKMHKSGDVAYQYVSSSVADKYFWYLKSDKSLKFHSFYHHYVCQFVKSLNKDGMDGLFTIENQEYTDGAAKFEALGPSTYYVDIPHPKEDVDFDLRGAYARYNWELFFHLPMLIANRLSQDQRFAEAQKWYHYVFNPINSANESSPQRYWNLLPFKTTPQQSLQELMDILDLPDGHEEKEALHDQIAQWRDDPFKPHLIARMRPMAYMKNVVMKYIDNLMAWGDYLFRQDSLESINEATQLYILAAEILGKKPEKAPARGRITPETYASLKSKLNEFSNAEVALETYFPFYSEDPFQPSNENTPALSPVFYFCLPDNDKLLEYWDIVADRLFKIRHCQNIEGVERQLALFEPPIDPALLVKAVAGGLDIGSVLNDINTPLPHYRFTYMLQKALEMAGELKSLGSTLLSTLEKKDAEELSMIRAVQETEMLKLVKAVRKLQIDEARTAYESLLRSRDTAVHRYIHYMKLLGEKSPGTPQLGAAIAEVSLPADKGSRGNGDKKLLSYERQDLVKSEEAADDQSTASNWEILSNVSYYLPEIQAEPWGIGVSFGGSHVGPALKAISGEYQRLSAKNSAEAAKASKLGGFFRREQDWVLQANLAAKEIMQLDKQLMAAEIRLQIADKELQNHEQQILNAQKIEEFLGGKYTNEELYGWMKGQLAGVFFQSYQIAYDLAKKAEKTYRFEHGLASSNFIEFGYWDSFRKGLLSGEKLFLSLKRLEKDYMEKNKREFEITKHISLRQLNPAALLQLRATGTCEFNVPEYLFDMDFPGHYFRRIKSVGLSIPCVAGPYTSVSAQLSLLGNRIRTKPESQSYGYTGIEDGRFVHNPVGIQSIATSSAQNDNGMFELNFRDERYLPFEGGGAISAWKLELPRELRQFDYNSISEVVLHVRYTARQGGAPLAQGATSYIKDEIIAGANQSVLSRLFSLKHDFPAEWHKYVASTNESFQATISRDHFPYIAQVGSIALAATPFELWTIDDQGTALESVPFSMTPEEEIILDPQGLNSQDRESGLEIVAALDKTKEVFLLVNYELNLQA